MKKAWFDFTSVAILKQNIKNGAMFAVRIAENWNKASVFPTNEPSVLTLLLKHRPWMESNSFNELKFAYGFIDFKISVIHYLFWSLLCFSYKRQGGDVF